MDLKHGINHSAYLYHVNLEKKHNLIRRYPVTDVAVHNSQVLEDILLLVDEGFNVWTDSAGRLAMIETQQKTRKLCSRVYEKETCNKSLTIQEKIRNGFSSQLPSNLFSATK